MSKTEIVLSNAFTPVFDIESIKEGLEAYHKAITTILTKDDVIKIGERTFIKKPGWNKLSLFFGISTDTIRSARVEHGDGTYTWTVVVTAYKEEYKVTRSASCHSIEKKHMDGTKTESRKDADVYAMAETRAVGRACSAFFGTGDVSYEEIIGSTPADLKSSKTGNQLCTCSPTERNPGQSLRPDGMLECRRCANPISSIATEAIMKQREKPPK